MIRIPIWLVVVFVVTVPSVMWAADVILPHVFTPGTTIRAAEVNANFEAVQSVRFTFTGGSQRRGDFYETTLSHPLLDGNSGAIIHVGIADFGRFATCATANGGSSPYFFLMPEYSGGRWTVVGTCPGAKYSVIAFREAR